jgi:hypothetical protein
VALKVRLHSASGAAYTAQIMLSDEHLELSVDGDSRMLVGAAAVTRPDPVLRAIQFAVTKLFGTGSLVPFFAAITSQYRKFMGSISERVIFGSNSNSPNNTG